MLTLKAMAEVDKALDIMLERIFQGRDYKPSHNDYLTKFTTEIKNYLYNRIEERDKEGIIIVLTELYMDNFEIIKFLDRTIQKPRKRRAHAKRSAKAKKAV